MRFLSPLRRDHSFTTPVHSCTLKSALHKYLRVKEKFCHVWAHAFPDALWLSPHNIKLCQNFKMCCNPLSCTLLFPFLLKLRKIGGAWCASFLLLQNTIQCPLWMYDRWNLAFNFSSSFILFFLLWLELSCLQLSYEVWMSASAVHLLVGIACRR